MTPSLFRLPPSALLAFALTCAVSGCSTLGTPNAALLPLQTAWFDGKVVHYVTTDVSHADVARDKGANTAPRLRVLVPRAGAAPAASALERVYAVANHVQPPVFPSAPNPVGSESRDAAYSPLWRMVQVQWLPGRTARELRSEEAVLQAADRGDVSLTVTDVVLNCAIIGVEGGPLLPGVRLLRDAASAPR